MAALDALEKNFRDPAFNATRLAAEISVSQRTLYNTFSSMGTTPAGSSNAAASQKPIA